MWGGCPYGEDTEGMWSGCPYGQETEGMSETNDAGEKSYVAGVHTVRRFTHRATLYPPCDALPTVRRFTYRVTEANNGCPFSPAVRRPREWCGSFPYRQDTEGMIKKYASMPAP